MGDSHRASLGDLLAEARDNRAVGAQDIAKAGGDESGAARLMAAFNGEAQGLDIDLGKALGAAHDIGRVHGLVGGDHHHLLHVVFDAFVGHVARACYVHQHCLARVLLHQRDVLVGRCVEDHLRAPFAEGIVQAGRETDVTDDRDEVQIRVPVLEFKTEVVHRCLGVVVEDKLLDPEAGELAAEFGSDGSCRSCHKNGLVLEVLHDLLHGDLDLRSHQEVFYLDVSCGMDRLSVHHLVHRRCEEEFDAVVDGVSYDAVLLFPRLIFRSKDQGLDAETGDYLEELLFRVHIIDLLLGDDVVHVGVAELDEAEDAVVGGVLEAAQKGD